MKKKILIRYIFIILLVFSACSENDNPVAPIDIASDTKINGPDEKDYDFYVGISYSDPQPADPLNKRFYAIISCEDSLQSFQNVKLKIDGQNILLQYANYFDKDFYIAYFNILYADNFDLELSVNGQVVNANLEVLDEIEIELPTNLTPQENLQLNWQTEKNPQVHYIEAFQISSDDEFLTQSIKNLEPTTREFTIPASWLWGNEEATSRAIQLGITNYVIEERVCFTISDGVFKKY